MYVVTLPKSAEKNPLAFARKTKKAGADILEIRGDLTPRIKALKSPLPILLSLRGALISRFSKINFEYLDLALNETVPVGLKRGVKIIRSFHDYKKTPALSELKLIEKKLRALNPWAIKIAVTIRSYGDLKTLEDFRRSLRKGQRSIILGMGIRADLNRMLSPLRDALTYTYIHAGEEAAEGQVPLSLYRLIKHCKKPRLFGLLGGLDIRSLSPLIHNTLFKRHGIDALYFLALTDDLADAWENLTGLGVSGFSVTSPWKMDVLKFLDRTEGENISVNTAVKQMKSKTAAGVSEQIKSGAGVYLRLPIIAETCRPRVDTRSRREGNTFLSRSFALAPVKQKGIWVGYPRDAEGLVNGFKFLKDARSACILGSGGVVPEVIRACKLARIRDIKVLARNRNHRMELARSSGVDHGPLLEAARVRPDILICAISADIAVPLARARKDTHAIDLRYGRQTKFLAAARKAGYKVHNGLPMLLHQALAQFQLFTGCRVKSGDAEYLRRLLRKSSPLADM